MKKYKFPELEEQYKNLIMTKLRGRKSLDNYLDYWVPSENKYQSFYYFLESILLNPDLIDFEFYCIFDKTYDSEKLLQEISKLNNNYTYEIINLDKNKELNFKFRIINQEVDSNKSKTTYKNRESNNIESKYHRNSFADEEFRDLFIFDTNTKLKFKDKELNKEHHELKHSFDFNEFSIDLIIKDNILIDCSYKLNKENNDIKEKILDNVLLFSINKPIREAYEHSAIKAMYHFINKEKVSKFGVITIKHKSAKNFLEIQNIFKEIFITIYKPKENFEKDYKFINEYFSPPPKSWTELTYEEKISCVNSYIPTALKKVNEQVAEIKADRIDFNIRNYEIRIVIKFIKNPNLTKEKSKILRSLEDEINNAFDYSFDVIAQFSKDTSKLRRKLKNDNVY